ncbi:TonB-dependent receptor [Ensifer sp.]|jgi:hemoglobin/transferrin/lactoferrin receptor protein|uniref:TonB-dependent receptor n=1 Tax=Ensifer sp. TaxID=1872086 RepID=UPI002E1345CB|nr:TonB-dependent receptor [Ensifer sp.]
MSRHSGRSNLLGAFVLASTTIGSFQAATPAAAQQGQTAGVTFDIPAQSLTSALTAFARQSGLKLAYSASLTAGKSAPAVHGAVSPPQALSMLLTGSGLTFRLNGGSVTIIERVSGAHAASPGGEATLLDPIAVRGGGINPVDAPYETAAPTAYISEENIDRFRGSSPADIFRGTPGVLSGEARNGAGAVDVNIRGMQGMGRVAVTVDGASNAATVYQGYQGISNRTFVDPDFLGGVYITKGSDVASNGIAGTVRMRTLDAGDIVKEGRTVGLRVKGGFGTNTSSPPPAGTTAGYAWPGGTWAPPVATAKSDGMDRPSLLDPTSGSGSIIGAMQEENVDLVAGYAYRRQGNYHAGTNGPAAVPISKGPQPYCYQSGICPPGLIWKDYIDNGGIANYRAGEEVLNTQLQTKSFLAKGTVRFEDGHSLQIGYNGFRSEAGDLLASRLTSDRGQAIQQGQTAGTKVDAGTLRYGWKPDDNDLIDLKANLWVTRLELRNPRRSGVPFPRPEDFGLPANYRTGSDTVMWGADVANTSVLTTDYGALDLTYGLSFQSEDTRPSAFTPELETWLDLRDGTRQEAAAFTKAAWQATDWLTVNGGLRYQHYWTEDRNAPEQPRQEYVYDTSLSDGGFSPSIGVTLEPIDGTQFYVNYSNALRSPSIMEGVSAFTMNVNSNLRPERSSNWEVGTNLRRDGLISADDQAMVKLGFFDWDVKDYIAREWYTDPRGISGMRIHNIAGAHFQGIELSARYERGGFAAELAANYYTDVEFCRTAATCGNKSLYADYATNQVPPEYTVALTLSQTLLDDALTVGGRVSRTGSRAIGHGDVTAQGASQFISLIDWKPYTLVDVFAEYKINDSLTASFRIENLTDAYYVDPLSLVQQPGPGRTFYASLKAEF